LAAVLTFAVAVVLAVTTPGAASASTMSSAGSSSASSVPAPQTRVGVSSPGSILLVEGQTDIAAGQRRGEAASRPQIVSGCCVAAEDAAGDGLSAIKPGSSGGPSAGKPFSQGVRQQVLDDNPSTCVYCHMDTDSPQVDHSIPKSRGGNATLDNGQTTCPWCNASKGAWDFPVNPPPGYFGPWPPPWWATETG